MPRKLWDASRIPPDMRSALTMVLDLPSDATDEQLVRAAARARSAEVGDRHCMDPAGPPVRGEPSEIDRLRATLISVRPCVIGGSAAGTRKLLARIDAALAAGPTDAEGST